jgi:hypothetical protein
MSNLEDIITRVADFIKRYRCISSIKINFTLGKYTEQFGFENNIFHYENYEKIINLLEKCSDWDNKKFFKGTKFKTEPEKVIDSLIILCNNGPYDILITVETKKNVDIYMSEDFIDDNKIYKRKNHTFHITKKCDNLNDKLYTASVTLDIPKDYKDTYVAHSSLLKMQDLINLCTEESIDLMYEFLQKNN